MTLFHVLFAVVTNGFLSLAPAGILPPAEIVVSVPLARVTTVSAVTG